jgi:hypothetical protein
MNWTPEELAARNREVLGIDRAPEPEPIMDKCPCGCGYPDQWKGKDWPEWMIERECTNILEQDGWRALRTDPVSDKGRGKGFGEVGMADHLYIRYSPQWEGDGKVLWIEFKSAKGKPAKHQILWHTKERARGALTLIAGQDFPASVEGFKTWYHNSGLSRNR